MAAANRIRLLGAFRARRKRLETSDDPSRPATNEAAAVDERIFPT